MRSAPHAAFAGKAFLWGLGALGAEGPGHVIDLMIDEMKSAFGQIGVASPAQARAAVVRHVDALAFAPQTSRLGVIASDPAKSS